MSLDRTADCVVAVFSQHHVLLCHHINELARVFFSHLFFSFFHVFFSVIRKQLDMGSVAVK